MVLFASSPKCHDSELGNVTFMKNMTIIDVQNAAEDFHCKSM